MSQTSPRQVDDIPPRYEHKFLVPLWQAEEIRRQITPFCVLDPFSAASPTRSYLITSLYLDTPHLGFYRQWEGAAPHRFKLRVRRYGESLGDSPVFLEVKERIEDVIIKRRAKLDHGDWLHHARDSNGSTANERSFTVRRDRYRCQPTLLVRYEREAYKGTLEAYARLTFDSRLQFQACADWSLEGDGGGWRAADDPESVDEEGVRVLVEIKFERDVPRWMVEVMRSLEMVRRGYSKYGTGLRWVHDPAKMLDPSGREPNIPEPF